MLKFAKAFGASFGLVLLGALFALAAQTSLPYPTVNGPFLGDSNNNLWTITDNYGRGTGYFAASGLSVSQTSGQSNCTQLGTDAFQQIGTSAATGYVCLPTAIAGKLVLVQNGTGQTIDVYGKGSDTINGTAGSTAYTGLTTQKLLICSAGVAAKWQCGSIS